MKLFFIVISTSILSLTLLSAKQTSKEEQQLQRTIKIATFSSQLLSKTLETSLEKKMEKDGIVNSLDFCTKEAYNITEKVNQRIPNGVRVKRINSKNRNPSNAPKPSELSILRAFQDLRDANAILPKYIIQRVDQNTDKYYQAILIEDNKCLKCHGDISKDIDIRRNVAANYPLDKAINYKIGDLIGAIIVTIKH